LDSCDIKLSVEYVSKQFDGIEIKKKEEKILDDL
jgi:hypothetical protein